MRERERRWGVRYEKGRDEGERERQTVWRKVEENSLKGADRDEK